MSPREGPRKPTQVPPMPRKAGGWAAPSRRRWKAWWTTGRAGRLDEVGLLTLEALLARADEAERSQSASMRLKLAKEVRLMEAALLRDFGDVAVSPADEAQIRRQRAQETRLRSREHRAALLSSLGIPEDALARLELSVLGKQQSHLLALLVTTDDDYWREHVLPARLAAKEAAAAA